MTYSYIIPSIHPRQLVKPELNLPVEKIQINQAALTLTGFHAGKMLEFLSACTVSIPSGIFAEETQVFALNASTEDITFQQADAGMTVVSAGSSAELSGQWMFAKITFRSPSVAVYNQLLDVPYVPSWQTIVYDVCAGTGTIVGRTPSPTSLASTWSNDGNALSSYSGYFSATSQSAGSTADHFAVITHSESNTTPLRMTGEFYFATTGNNIAIALSHSHVSTATTDRVDISRGGAILGRDIDGGVANDYVSASIGTLAITTYHTVQLTINPGDIELKVNGVTALTHSRDYSTGRTNKVAWFLRGRADRMRNLRLEAFK